MSVTYNLAEFLNDRSTVQIPWDNPPATITTTIPLYIDFNHYYFNFSGNTNATIVARLQVISIYSGTSLPVNNTIVPEVTLTNPNGTEGSSLEFILKNTTAGIEYCYSELQNINHTIYHVQANIHSPNMYSQLGEHNFTIRLTFHSPDSLQLTQNLQYRTDTYTLIVDITTTSMLYKNIIPMTLIIVATELFLFVFNQMMKLHSHPPYL